MQAFAPGTSKDALLAPTREKRSPRQRALRGPQPRFFSVAQLGGTNIVPVSRCTKSAMILAVAPHTRRPR